MALEVTPTPEVPSVYNTRVYKEHTYHHPKPLISPLPPLPGSDITGDFSIIQEKKKKEGKKPFRFTLQCPG